MSKKTNVQGDGPLMLRLDGEVWHVQPDHDTDENSVNCREAKLPNDKKAIEAGVSLIQTQYGGKPYHEVKMVR